MLPLHNLTVRKSCLYHGSFEVYGLGGFWFRKRIMVESQRCWVLCWMAENFWNVKEIENDLDLKMYLIIMFCILFLRFNILEWISYVLGVNVNSLSFWTKFMYHLCNLCTIYVLSTVLLFGIFYYSIPFLAEILGPFFCFRYKIHKSWNKCNSVQIFSYPVYMQEKSCREFLKRAKFSHGTVFCRVK